MMLLTLNSLNNVARFFTLLLVFIFVLAITYFTTRFIAGYQKGKMQGSNIKIIETARIAQDKYIQIIQIGTKYIAIAISKNEVSFLTELSGDELSFKEEQENALPGFADILNRMKEKKNIRDNRLDHKESGKAENCIIKEKEVPVKTKLKVFDLKDESLKEENAVPEDKKE